MYPELTVVEGRKCGSCDMCCRVIGVDDPGLQKPPGTPCLFLNSIHDGSGCCGIYNRRPAPCAQYRCMWLDHELPDEAAPEHTGVVCDSCYVGQPDGGGFNLITVVAISSQALQDSWEWIEKLAVLDQVVMAWVCTADDPTAVICDSATLVKYKAFCEDIQRNGLILQGADGRHEIGPDGVEVRFVKC